VVAPYMGQKLKSCHQAGDRRVSAPGSRQGPRAPRGNSVADKDATPAEVQTTSKAKLHCINRRPRDLLLEPSMSTMAKQLSNSAMPWSCVRPPERSARESFPGSRRMLAKSGELHQPLHPRPARNPGAAWGSTCLDRSCERRPEAMLGISMLRRERSEVKLARFGIL
jgi:hypothetical protein